MPQSADEQVEELVERHRARNVPLLPGPVSAAFFPGDCALHRGVIRSGHASRRNAVLRRGVSVFISHGPLRSLVLRVLRCRGPMPVGRLRARMRDTGGEVRRLPRRLGLRARPLHDREHRGRRWRRLRRWIGWRRCGCQRCGCRRCRCRQSGVRRRALALRHDLHRSDGERLKLRPLRNRVHQRHRLQSRGVRVAPGGLLDDELSPGVRLRSVVLEVHRRLPREPRLPGRRDLPGRCMSLRDGHACVRRAVRERHRACELRVELRGVRCGPQRRRHLRGWSLRHQLRAWLSCLRGRVRLRFDGCELRCSLFTLPDDAQRHRVVHRRRVRADLRPGLPRMRWRVRTQRRRGDVRLALHRLPGLAPGNVHLRRGHLRSVVQHWLPPLRWHVLCRHQHPDVRRELHSLRWPRQRHLDLCRWHVQGLVQLGLSSLQRGLRFRQRRGDLWHALHGLPWGARELDARLRDRHLRLHVRCELQPLRQLVLLRVCEGAGRRQPDLRPDHVGWAQVLGRRLSGSRSFTHRSRCAGAHQRPRRSFNGR